MSNIRTITRLDPGQFGLVIGSMYLIIGIIVTVLFAIIMKLVSSAAPPSSAGLGQMATGFGLVFLPIIYAIFGYIFGIVGALIYNLLAGIVGGIRVTVSES